MFTVKPDMNNWKQQVDPLRHQLDIFTPMNVNSQKKATCISARLGTDESPKISFPRTFSCSVSYCATFEQVLQEGCTSSCSGMPGDAQDSARKATRFGVDDCNLDFPITSVEGRLRFSLRCSGDAWKCYLFLFHWRILSR